MAPAGSRPAAVLWDLDGTLIDTEPIWIAAETELAARYGRTWTPEQGLTLVGRDLLDSGRILQEVLALPMSPAEIVDELVRGVEKSVSESVTWRPGALELLLDCRAASIPCALVTMSYRSVVVPVLASLPEATFAAVVTGDEVAHGKPHPEPYLAAAELLGVAARDCLAIEDSLPGATSAAAAGCAVLVVPHHVPVPPGPGLLLRDTLQGIDHASLSGIAARG